MKCETAREAISAQLDDEDPGVDRAQLEDHLADCADCSRWRAAAHEVTRNARLEPARVALVSDDELVDAVLAHSRLPRRPGAVTWVRIGLVAVAAAQVWVTVSMLASGHDHTTAHIAHEVGAFALALAVGFVVAAWKPDRARGMHALAGAVAVLLVVTSTLDLLNQHTDMAEEAPHLLAVAGWLLLVYLAGATPSQTLGPSRALRSPLRTLVGRGTESDLVVDEPISKAGGTAANRERRAG